MDQAKPLALALSLATTTAKMPLSARAALPGRPEPLLPAALAAAYAATAEKKHQEIAWWENFVQLTNHRAISGMKSRADKVLTPRSTLAQSKVVDQFPAAPPAGAPPPGRSPRFTAGHSYFPRGPDGQLMPPPSKAHVTKVLKPLVRRANKGLNLPPMHTLRPEVQELLKNDPGALDALLRESGLSPRKGGGLSKKEQEAARLAKEEEERQKDPKRRLDPALVAAGVRVPGVTAVMLRELQSFMRKKWEVRIHMCRATNTQQTRATGVSALLHDAALL